MGVANGPPLAALDIQVPLADEDLIAHRQRLLQQVLPGLHQPKDSLERAITQMAVAITQNTADNCHAREEKAAREQDAKLPSEKYTATIGILQEYLLQPDERELPALWHQWANCNKKQEFNVLTEQLQAYSRSNDSFSPCPPVASAKLLQDLQNFVFVGESADDIKTGLQPFIITEGSAEHHQANIDLAHTYGMLHAGDHNLLLSDLEALKAKEVQSLPLTYFELERNLGMFGNLLGTVLGTTHILMVRYREFWTSLSQAYRLEIQQVIDNKRYIKAAHILRSVQLYVSTGFTSERHGSFLRHPILPQCYKILF
jgi:hypothetical protein